LSQALIKQEATTHCKLCNKLSLNLMKFCLVTRCFGNHNTLVMHVFFFLFFLFLLCSASAQTTTQKMCIYCVCVCVCVYIYIVTFHYIICVCFGCLCGVLSFFAFSLFLSLSLLSSAPNHPQLIPISDSVAYMLHGAPQI